MSVNLNILANKAIRGYADVDDISTATDVYTSGSSYILYAINNDANIPVTGLPQQNEYCSQSILWVSQTSSFENSVTQSFIACNSSSLSGSYLYYGSFTDSQQPGGFLEDNKGYLYRIFDRTIDYAAINSGLGKSYYFKNYKIADFGYIGDFSNVDSTNLMLPNTAPTTTLNANRWLYFWEAKGYDNVTNTLWRNYPPTFVSGTSPGSGGGTPNSWPEPFDASSSIAGGGITGATPEIVMYGNGGSPALKTNGATLTLPMASSLVQSNFVLTLCIIQGEVTMSTTPVDGNSLTLQASAENNKISLLGTGAPFNSSTLNNTIVRNAIISVKSRVTTVSPTADGFTQIFVANLNGQANAAEARWESAGPRPAGSTAFTLGSPWTLTTSADCVLRFVTAAPNTQNDLGGLATAYYATNGLYTGSLNGTITPPPPPPTSSLLTGSSVLPIPSSSVANLFSGFGFPSDNYLGYENVTASGWMDMNMSSSKYVQSTGSFTSQSAGILFNGTTSTLSVLSSSLSGIGNTNYTVQFIGTLPGTSSQLNALFGNPDYTPQNNEDVVYRNNGIPASASIDFRTNLTVAVSVNRYTIPNINTSSLQLLTFMSSGSTFKVYNGLTQLSATTIGGGVPNFTGSFNLFDNMTANGRGIYFGYNNDLDTDNYSGSLHNLLIYSRSLSDAELSSSFQYFQTL